MRPVTRTRPSLLPRLLFGGALLVVGCFGTVATLAALGVPIPFLHRAPPPPSHEGLVAVPICGQRIPMYTRVTRDFLFDPKSKQLQEMWLNPDMVKRNRLLVRFDEIVGRVVNHDKPVGYPFTEEDFFPKGTQPGMVAGIPPGKISWTLEVDKIHGIRDMAAGDHFDLLSSLPIEMKPSNPSQDLLIMPSAAMNISPVKRAAVKVLVHNGVVVYPVTTKQVPVSNQSLTSGLTTRMKPIQEITIALDPTEAPYLAQALTVSAEITCIAHSGRPEDSRVTPRTPDLKPPPRKVIEIINGPRRQLLVFPEDGDGAPEVKDLTPEADSPSSDDTPATKPATPPRKKKITRR